MFNKRIIQSEVTLKLTKTVLLGAEVRLLSPNALNAQTFKVSMSDLGQCEVANGLQFINLDVKKGFSFANSKPLNAKVGL